MSGRDAAEGDKVLVDALQRAAGDFDSSMDVQAAGDAIDTARTRLLATLATLRSERDDARSALAAMHRRAQAAEGAAQRARAAYAVPACCADAARSLDAALANLAECQRERVGIWRCSGCGAGLYAWELPDTRWRMADGRHEHQCGDPQAGCEPADFFAWSAAEVVAYVADLHAALTRATERGERMREAIRTLRDAWGVAATADAWTVAADAVQAWDASRPPREGGACTKCDGRGWYYTNGTKSYGRERCACGAALSEVGRAQVGDVTARAAEGGGEGG